MVLVTTTRDAVCTCGMSYGPDGHQPGQERQEAAHPRVGAGVLDDVEPVGEDPAVPGPADLDGLLAGPARASCRPGSRCASPPSAAPGRSAGPPRRPAIASRSMPTLAPNPPPTSGAITRIAAGSRPSAPARMNRVICAFCVLTQNGQLAVGPPGRGGAPLQRHRGEPLVHDRPLDHDIAAVEDRVVGGLARVTAHVRLGAGEQQRLGLPARRRCPPPRAAARSPR